VTFALCGEARLLVPHSKAGPRVNKVRDFNSDLNAIRINGADHWVTETDTPHIQGDPFPGGTSVFAKIGEALKHNRVRLLTRHTFIDNNLMGAVPKDGVIEPVYLFQLLRTFDFAAYNSGTAVPYVTASVLGSAPVIVPPRALQQRITSILGAYDDLIELNHRRITLLEEMARRLFEEWFVRFRFPGYESAMGSSLAEPSAPKEWVSMAIRELGKVVTGKTPSKAKHEYFGGSVPFIKIPDMHNGNFVLSTSDRLSDAGVASQSGKMIPPGSLCVSCIGTIGLVAITTEPSQTNQQINSVILHHEHLREFLFFALKAAKTALQNLGSTGATMGNVNKDKFETLKLLVPTDGLLHRYHELVAPMFSAMLNHSRATHALITSRDLLLPRLISGELPVTVERELETAA
jgi:type I restriction enzyme S subunit